GASPRNLIPPPSPSAPSIPIAGETSRPHLPIPSVQIYPSLPIAPFNWIPSHSIPSSLGFDLVAAGGSGSPQDDRFLCVAKPFGESVSFKSDDVTAPNFVLRFGPEVVRKKHFATNPCEYWASSLISFQSFRV
uniref:Uncharacterized protein n=1 Tax=Aegilops tauschii subsp. strangulata TaxID=200361 RepID=A0A453T0Z2_AEGTS